MRALLGHFLIALALAAGVFGTPSHAQQPAIPLLFSYQPTGTAADDTLGVPATLNLAGLSRVLPGGLVNFATPDGRSFLFVFDTYRANRTGGAHWIGHLDGSGGENFRAILTWGSAGFGHIATPDGDFLLETSGGVSRLVDMNRSGRRIQRFGDDAPFAPPPERAPESGSGAGEPLAAADLPPGFTQIDVMVIYTVSYANRIGADAVRPRIEFLVAAANQAYIDSQVNIQLNLVHSAPASYAYTDINTALPDLANNRQNGGAINSGFGGIDVATLRNQYGADLVVLLREFDANIDTSAVGLGFLVGGAANGNLANMNPAFAFAVVDDGADINGSGVSSGTYTFAHELGHNMGSTHDRGNANGQGVYYYSYGYGVAGQLGTIMSYVGPSVGRFSNPGIACGNPVQACGVSEAGNNITTSANNALSLNNARVTVAGFRAPTGLSTTPNAFGFTALVGVTGGDNLVSEAITVGGLTSTGGIAAGATAPISITGGTYSINGGTFTAAAGTVTNGDSVQVRVTASLTAYASATAYLTIGAVTRAFSAVTRPASFAVTPAVTAGFEHALALRADGTLFAWGLNTSGQLGDGSVTSPVKTPEALAIAGVKAIDAGQNATLALKTDGTVWVWGTNSSCEFGTGDFNCSAPNPLLNSTPQQITGLSGISKISMGPFGGLALKGDGSVWSWGFSGSGANLIQIDGGPGVPTVFSAIAAGNSFSLAVATDQTVWAWGSNSSSQLGYTNTGTYPLVDFPFPYPQVPGLSGITAVAAGSSHGLALKSNGTVWAWGDNSSGQLGDGTGGTPGAKRAAPAQVAGLPVITAIAAGNGTSFAVGADGSLWAWGDNTYGQLGDGSSGTDRLSPVPIALGNVVAVSNYLTHTVALLKDGSVYAWGNNCCGQLGNNGATGSSSSPTRVGAGFWYVGNADTEPSAFSFAARASAVPNTPADSAGVTVGGISLGSPISVSGGLYSINGGAFTAAVGTVNNGDQVRARVTASATPGVAQTGTVTIGGVNAGFTATARARADLDGAGKSDLFWLHASLTQTYVWQMNGAAISSAGSPASTGDTTWQVKGVGDFDGDGKADVLFRHKKTVENPDHSMTVTGTGTAVVWLMNGATIAGSGSPGTVADLGWEIQGVGDFDGDGKADVLWMHTDGRVQVWLMNGVGTSVTSAVISLGASSGWMVQGIGDFNGDGKADILWKHTNGTVVMWFMNGATIASSGTVASVGTETATSWKVLGVGDFNGDGKADVLWRNDDIGGVIYVWLMNGTTITSATNVTGVGTEAATGWIVKAIGDYDGDGKADVFWKNDLTLGGITYVWLMNGTTITTATSVTGVADTGWQVFNPK